MFSALDAAVNITDYPIAIDPSSWGFSSLSIAIATRHMLFLATGVLARVASTFALMVLVIVLTLFGMRKVVCIANSQCEEPVKFVNIWREYTSISTRSAKFIARAFILSIVLAIAFSVFLLIELLVVRNASTSKISDENDEDDIDELNDMADRELDEIDDILAEEGDGSEGEAKKSATEAKVTKVSQLSQRQLNLILKLRQRNQEMYSSVLTGGFLLLVIAEASRSASEGVS